MKSHSRPKCRDEARQKRDAGMALNLTELSHVTGYGVSSLRGMNLPLVKGKIRAEDFWRHVRKLQDYFDSISK